MSDSHTIPSPTSPWINTAVSQWAKVLNQPRFSGGYAGGRTFGKHVMNLGVGEVADIAGQPEMHHLYAQALQEYIPQSALQRYNGALGYQKTNQAMAKLWNGYLGEPRFDESLVASYDGGHNAIEALMRVCTGPPGMASTQKFQVMMGAPCYPYFASAICAYAGLLTFSAYSAEEWIAEVEAFCHEGVGLILLNVPNNPMGYTLNPAQVRRLNRVAQKHNCVIVVDAVYATYDVQGQNSMATLAQLDAERTVFVDSFSKKYGLPGIRLGFTLCANPVLSDALRLMKMAESLAVGHDKLHFAHWLLTHHQDMPQRIASEIWKRKSQFLERFNVADLEGVRLVGGERNAFYQMLDITELCQTRRTDEMSVATFCQQHYQVEVMGGGNYHPSSRLSCETIALKNGILLGQAQRCLPALTTPNAQANKRQMLRLTFGCDSRIEQAAIALNSALTGVANGELKR